MNPSQIIHGIGGLAKVAAQQLGVDIDKAPDAVVAQRRDVCRGCDHATRKPDAANTPTRGLTSLSVCRQVQPDVIVHPRTVADAGAANDGCGCFIAAKTRIASESCPLRKWTAV